MFEIGDLVRFKKAGVVTIMRRRPSKKWGVIFDIHREAYQCYSGDMDDRIFVKWLGTDIEEVMPELYKEKVA